MRRNRLNLSALRKNRLSALAQPRADIAQPGPAQGLTFSRRELLGLAGAAAVGASPTLQAIRTALAGPFQLAANKKRAAFKLAGRERWAIDTRRFAGSPSLTVEKSDGLIRVLLTNARYPGTDLPADLTCELRPAVVGWRMSLKMSLGGFQCEVPFEPWLLGVEAARARVSLDAPVCPLGRDSRLALSGSAEAEFSPQWVLRFDGSKTAHIYSASGETLCDSLAISLSDSNDSSIMSPRPSKRTLLRLERGRRAWRLERLLPVEAKDKLRASGSPFDIIRVEVGEGPDGARCAWLADGQGEGRLSFYPGADLTDIDGQPFGLPLRDARYAVAHDPSGDQGVLLASFSEEPVWFHQEGSDLQVGDSPGPAAFELHALSGRVKKVKCEPALLAVSAPLADVIVELGRPPEGTRLEFVSASTKSPVLPGHGDRLASAGKSATPSRPPLDAGQVLVLPRGLPAIVRVPLNFTVSVLRPQDLLSLRFEFINFNLETGGGKPARLVRTDPAKPAYMVVHFPPQNIAEQAFWEAAPEFADAQDEALKEPPVSCRISGPSRLAFLVANEVQEIPYTLESLLAWAKHEQSVVSAAQPPPPPVQLQFVPVAPTTRERRPAPRVDLLRPATPNPVRAEPRVVPAPVVPIPGLLVRPKLMAPELRHTALELPYRLILSPSRFGGWFHAIQAMTRNGRTELWHTRLGVRRENGVMDEQDDYYRTVRAIWSPDCNANDAAGGPDPDHLTTTPFRMPLDRQDRHEIVHLSADFLLTRADGKPYEPEVIRAQRLMLTALGAWLDSRGAWSRAPAVLQIEEWRHRATMGRDHYVRVVRKGYLFPFGHRASLVTVTERKFHPKEPGNPAYLRQRMYIVVRQPEREYPAFRQPKDGRRMPFRRVRVTTLVTPNLNKAADSAVDGLGQSAFWPRVGEDDFLFHMVGEDADGQRSEFTSPVIFVSSSIAFTGTMSQVRTHYVSEDKRPLRQRPWQGQKTAFAPSTPGKPGDTTLETQSITFGAEPPEGEVSNAALEAADQPRFYPLMEQAVVHLPAAKQLAGAGATTIQLHNTYVDKGLDSSDNQGQVFAQLADPLQLDFGASKSADRSGGIITPNMAISGLSRLLGPVGGDLNEIVGGKFDPMKFFAGALSDAKILGGISLKDILETIEDFTGALEKVPRMISETIYEAQIPKAIETRLRWEPIVRGDPTGIFVNQKNAQKATMAVDVKVVTKLDGSAPTYDVRGELRNFTMDLFAPVLSFLRLKFNGFTFTAKSGSKTDVDVDFDDIEFAGPLGFINELRNYIPLTGFKDPPSLDVTAEGIRASYSLGIPSVAFGVFSLENISLSAALNIPFDGQPVRVRFAFCERENPFLLTVSMFGGGGFFGVALGLDGVEILEASLEFGGSLSLDIGVASGGVYVMAGIYFKLEGEAAVLTGYLRCGGGLEILGIITISVEFYLGLTYESVGNKVWGEATLTVEIEILFFSVSVDMSVRREFAGSPAPAFADLMGENHWLTYCEAFA